MDSEAPSLEKRSRLPESKEGRTRDCLCLFEHFPVAEHFPSPL
jgi:hypothetical protein